METLAQQLRNEGKIEGKIEGIRIGEKRGIRIVEKRWKDEKREIARKMLLNNFPVEQVINIVGLTAKEIKSLMN